MSTEDRSESESEKILLMIWDRDQDSITMPTPQTNITELKITKRNMLTYLASFFDPLGLISPVVLQAKQAFQLTWSSPDLKWDDIITDEQTLSAWNKAVDFLKDIKDVTINRVTWDAAIMTTHV
jgi:hypothetical protein